MALQTVFKLDKAELGDDNYTINKSDNTARNQKLMELATEAAKRAYVPYSKFHVGAALLTEDGMVYTGCNIENAAFTPTNCAERTAFFTAVNAGERHFKAIAVLSLDGEAWPCGVCRQVMNEFCDGSFEIISYDKERNIVVETLETLLPHRFSLEIK